MGEKGGGIANPEKKGVLAKKRGSTPRNNGTKGYCLTLLN